MLLFMLLVKSSSCTIQQLLLPLSHLKCVVSGNLLDHCASTE